MEDARPGMVRRAIVVEHEVADDKDPAGLKAGGTPPGIYGPNREEMQALMSRMAAKQT